MENDLLLIITGLLDIKTVEEFLFVFTEDGDQITVRGCSENMSLQVHAKATTPRFLLGFNFSYIGTKETAVDKVLSELFKLSNYWEKYTINYVIKNGTYTY